MPSLVKFEDCREQIEILRKYGNLEADRISTVDAAVLSRLILSQQGELETLREAVKNPGYGDRNMGQEFDSRSVEADKKVKAYARDRSLSYSEALDRLVEFGEVDCL